MKIWLLPFKKLICFGSLLSPCNPEFFKTSYSGLNIDHSSAVSTRCRYRMRIHTQVFSGKCYRFNSDNSYDGIISLGFYLSTSSAFASYKCRTFCPNKLVNDVSTANAIINN